MRINGKRLQETMNAVNKILVTEQNGINRVALSKEDKTARDMLAQWFKEAGLVLRVDDLGNMYGRREGTAAQEKPVCIGSHLDTQPNGGRYDGTLGVLAALEVVRTLNDHGVKTKAPIEIINWTNEEGARFQPALMGSGVVGGLFEKDWIYNQEDKNGLRFEDELVNIGYKGEKENRFFQAKCYLELHIEQGPVLDKAKRSVGVVRGISGTCWFRVFVQGEKNHSGTCPMDMRKDALASAARMLVSMRERIREMDAAAVVTVGELTVAPNVINIIPDEVHFSIDLRSPALESLQALEKELRRIIETIAAEEQTQVSVERIWYSEPVDFAPEVVDSFKKACAVLEMPYEELISGANHDAKSVSSMVPTGMLFVRSIGARSHCPEEESDWKDIENAANVLLQGALQLAGS